MRKGGEGAGRGVAVNGAPIATEKKLRRGGGIDLHRDLSGTSGLFCSHTCLKWRQEIADRMH